MAVPLTLSSVPAQTPYVQYIATAGQTVFPYPFEITQDSDLVVLLNGAVQPTDGGYTLSGQGATGGGSVTFTVGLTAGTIVTFYRNISIARITQLAQNGTFFSANFNNEYNRIYLILQQLQQSLPGGNSAFSLMVPNSNSPRVSTLLTPALYANSYLYFDANGNPQPAVNITGTTLTASVIGNLTGPATQAEINAVGLTVTDTTKAVGNVLRYGIVPNSTGAATSNTAILNAYANAAIVNGPVGPLVFPNTTGADTYYFNYGVGVSSTQWRDGSRVNLGGCTINITGTYGSAFAGLAFWNAIRDVTVENGTVVINYPSPSAGAGPFMNIGSRYGGPAFGTFTGGILDQDMLVANGLPYQGNILLQNLRISTNCPGTQVINATGGLRNTTFRNLFIDCGSQATGAIYYEYGFASTNSNPGTPSLWTTSHAQNLRFENVHAQNVITGAQNFGFGANGAWSVSIDGMYVNGSDVGGEFGAGEAFYYRPWSLDTAGGSAKPWVSIRNFNSVNCPTGLALSGAGVCSFGTLMYPVINALTGNAKSLAQTDLLSFFVDGFSVSGVTGISVTGLMYSIRNGTIQGNGVSSSGGILTTDDSPRGKIENVTINGVNGEGIRADNASGSPLWGTIRPKVIEIRDCKITNCTNIGIGLNHTQSALIENCILGANTTYDVAADTVQTVAVNAGSTANGVVCRNNFTSVASGGTNYAIITGIGVIEGERNGTPATSGNWVTQTPSLTNTGYGTPTNTAVISSINGSSTYTVVQLAGMIAALTAVLKQNGLLGT